MIVVDTAPIVAAAIVNDRNHRECVDLFTGLHLARRRLLVSPLVVAEVCYLVGRDGGSAAEAAFLTAVHAGDFELVDLVAEDLERMIELVTTYADLGLGAADASVFAIAERLRITEVATLDRRHFTVVRPRHVDALVLLP